MPEAGAKSIRGPLRYDVETSSPQMEAGKKFSVTMQITNPYDVPVTIYDLNTQLPIELKDPTIPTDKKGFVSLMKQRVLAVIPNPGVGPRIEPGPEPVPALGPGDPTIELQPGNSTVRTFAIKTTSAIFSRPLPTTSIFGSITASMASETRIRSAIRSIYVRPLKLFYTAA